MVVVSQSGSVSLSPVIVTGGCGFTGSHLVDGLLESEKDQGCDIHVIARNVRNEVPGVTYHKCDITSAEEVQSVFNRVKPKTVFHVATPSPNVLQPASFRAINVGGTRILLAAAASVNTVQAFVFTSSASVSHLNTADAFDVSEDDPIIPYPREKRVYTLTKGEAETMVLAANRRGGTSEPSMLTASIRPGGIFGERDYGCAGRIIANARRGSGRYQFGNGQNVSDFVYVGNLVDGHILVARALVQAYGKPPISPESGKRVEGEIFNIINEKRVKFWEFQRSIAGAAGFPIREEDVKSVPVWLAFLIAFVSEWVVWAVSFGKRQPLITRDAVRNTVSSRTLAGEKARRVLGYEPQVSMEEAVARTGQWFKEEAKREGEAKKNA